MTPETKSVVLIKCVHCGKWNHPKVLDDGTIQYPKGCQNRECRRQTYAGQTDTRVTPEFKAKFVKNGYRGGNHTSKKPKTYAQLYKR